MTNESKIYCHFSTVTTTHAPDWYGTIFNGIVSCSE
ncbi:CxxxxCH/CxxCH domain-containing protein [Patescibacteria group bacterium]|nr:CxxxxCH/CxxCH domain-containing protein [Patescibacteria group bacterium]